MQVETKELEYCKVHVFYTGDSDVIEAKTEEAVAKLREVQIPGFRKGKAPDYAIKARCKQKIRDWVAREMSAQAYDDMVFETNMKPVGMPEYKNISLKKNKDSNKEEFSCELIVMKKPDFELKPYSGYEINKPELNRDVDSQVNHAVENLRTRFGDVVPYEEADTVSVGDQVTMSFKAVIDGETFDGSTVEGELYQIGQNKFPGFDDYIIGMKAGEEREFDLVFPDEFPELGGKTASFKVTVHMGTKRKPCELNEEFFEKVGVKDKEEFYDRLTMVVKKTISDTENNLLRNEIAQRLTSENDFEIPKFMIEAECKHFCAQNGMVFERLEASRKDAINQISERNVRLALILDTIRDEEPDAVLNDLEAQQKLMQRAVAHGQDPNKFLVEAQKTGAIYGMIAALKDEFALQWVISKAKIKEIENGSKEEA